ncbi:MAG: family 10 glycosylhydrolase, partial [Armatimonadetes bacterium]|nr:family 10 glycosylhydrolase [Armatimonadota bacterium]
MALIASLVVALMSQPAGGQVVVVRGTYAAKAGSGEAGSAGQFYEVVARALNTAGVEFAAIEDEDVAAGKLQGAKVAIFPYTPRWAPGETDAAVQFVQSGGKVFVFYTIERPLAAALGLAGGEYTPAPAPGAFAECRLAQGAPEVRGTPEKFVQNSWNINSFRPGRDDCKVLYEWYTSDGQPTGRPAMMISDSGVYMTHVLTAMDITTKGRLLLALIGHFVPDIWVSAAQRAVEGATRFVAFSSMDELRAIVRQAKDKKIANDPDEALARAEKAWQNIQQARQEQRFVDVLDGIDPFRAAAAEAYTRCLPSRDYEMRAVWIHTAFGVGDGKWGWEKSIRHLKEMGFNAILPNMLWGGVAYYESSVLPVHDRVKQEGDQVAECAKCCKQYGVELHVWKVNWNLGGGHTPDWFRQQLLNEGRLQVDPEGKTIDWLCPSDERNFRLERDSMLELVEKYDIAGIHFDYIRYPGMNGCYCDRCRRLFEERIGKKVDNWPQDVLQGPYRQEWLQFRRDNITRLVRSVSEKAHQIKPDIKVSAAVFGYWDGARDSVGQDWVQWVKEGLLDFVCPMDYIPDNAALRSLVARQVAWVSGRVPLYIGLGEWRLEDAVHLGYQIQMIRELGADGFVLFHYDHPEITDARMPLLRLGPTRLDAGFPHRAPKVNWQLPPGLEGWPENSYREGAQLSVTAQLDARAAAPGALELWSVDGRQLQRLGDVRPGGRVTAVLKVPQTPVRLVVAARDRQGRTIYAAGGPFLWPVSEEKLKEAEARNRPPQFKGTGISVGVYAEGYGSEPILQALNKAGGIEALPVYSLAPEMLKPCRVFVLPQPKRPEVITDQVVKALRDFVKAGGVLIATHDAVGFRR